MKFPKSLIAASMTFALTACEPAPAPVEDSTPAQAEVETPTVGSSALLPQLTFATDGQLVLSWIARRENGIDLFVARGDGETFGPAVRLNPELGSVSPITIDEMRPAVASGPGNRVAVAWTDRAYDIQVALSEDGGQSFAAPIRINQDEGDALQEFPSIAFDDEGVLHAVWLDPRFATDIVEEPADLYYARIDGGTVTEQNLTADQESTVCGCCLPDLDISGTGITITFRNTTDDGYRDPFRITGTIDGNFSAPVAVTTPVWQINACPVAGPIGVGEDVLWLDGSLGHRRLLRARGPDLEPEVVLEDTGEWFLDVPPRAIAGTPEDEPLLLVPSFPAYVIAREEGQWQVVINDLPGWVSNAARVGDELVMVGMSNGRYVTDRRPLELD
jgi:hypothetical protein